MLEIFSHTLVELYEIAEHIELNAFAPEIIRLAKKLIDFDGAVLGMGESSGSDLQNLVIHNAFVHGRDPKILSDYAEISTADPMTKKFLVGLPEPLVNSYATIESGKRMNGLRAFYKSHDLQHLLLFGCIGNEQKLARWLVLYRGAGDIFSEQARQHIAALWPHVVRGFSINQSCFLHQQFPSNQHCGVALVSSSGTLELADPIFKKLCALEWPAGAIKKIPDVVWDSWRRGLHYVGIKVKFTVHLRHEGFIVSQAFAIGPLDRLTSAEHIVAIRFAAGLSAKAIANALGLSVHTVRTQLSQVYKKLNIHDKGELASHLLKDGNHYEFSGA